ncbi:hypothetical protein FOZ61_010676 [Perkinsus olseni]|uniref:Uncharacterized protein n=1 Tax=Perkinsus olseni TaxID=32597 RepID=A0A7J6KV58_PEROL|nr:hypothetical protein FOZ61_010676 [Perkinsus olseni]KAF4652669.1 hypothetical protein FOL46_009559 [Perkinsus olseni]
MSQVVREQEVLYARVGRNVEFFFIPWNSAAVDTNEESRRLGLTRQKKTFPGKARSQENDAKETSVIAYDFVPYNCWNITHPGPRGSGRSVAKAQILRVVDGKTAEYIADVVHSGGCFERIEVMTSSYTRQEGAAVEEAPQYVQHELRQICNNGFAALKPSSSLPKLDGIDVGSRDERNPKLRFRDGVIEDADLIVEKFTDIYPFVTYQPLCSGIVSYVAPSAIIC